MATISGNVFTSHNVDDSAGTARDLKSNLRSMNITHSNGEIDISDLSEEYRKRLEGLKDITLQCDYNVDTEANKSKDVVVVNIKNNRTVGFSVNGLSFEDEMLITEMSIDVSEDHQITCSVSYGHAEGTPTWS